MHSFKHNVEAAIRDLKNGKMIILTDHADRENEGDIIFPAELVTDDMMNFMIRHGSGIVCLALTDEKLKQLGVPFMVPPHENASNCGTPFSVSIEAKEGITTGVSAKDRATTVLTAVREGASENDIVKPGHIFPLRAKRGGVLERAGHTEGSTDLMQLAGYKPAAIICEVMNEDGSMARGEELRAFADKHDISILAIEDIINYRLCHEDLIHEETSAQLPLDNYGMFQITIVKEKYNGNEHIMMASAHADLNTPCLVRIHSACMTGDLFGSMRCDCNQQLHYSLERISIEGGILIYLSQEGRGIGLFNKIKSYALQSEGLDTIEANECLKLPVDARKYNIAANLLKNRNIHDVRLLTNNPNKIDDLKKYGIAQVTREEMPVFHNKYNQRYLLSKKMKLNHLMSFDFASLTAGK